MLRALPPARAVGAPSGARLTLRTSRRRFATEPPPAQTPPPPKKRKHPFRRLVVYATAATATFYVGSAFVAFSSPQYYDLFIDKVPLGASVIQYAEDHGWDTLTVEQVVDAGKDGVAAVQRLISGEQLDKAKQKTKDIYDHTRETSKERVKAVKESLKNTARKSEAEAIDTGAKAAEAAKQRAIQFSEGVEDLVKQAEAALAGKPKPAPQAPAAPPPPEVSPEPAPAPPQEHETPPRENGDGNGRDVYPAPLPIGFEPPPGYKRPPPPQPTPAPPAQEAAQQPAPSPLPLVAPAVAEFGASEPVIAQLASVIDSLASYLSATPAAAEKARDVLDTAKVDLTQLAARIEQVKEEERRKLEAKLDEQTREYTLKLLEHEMEAQDRLDSQHEDFRKFFDEEKLRFVRAYREKLDRELQAQSEIINERLKEEVIAQGIEMQRRWIREIKMRVEQERGGRLAKLSELSTNLKRLERIALDNSAYLDENLRLHALHSALRALAHTVESSPTRQPFRDELRVLRHVAAARDDPVIASALDALEGTDVPDVGVEPFADLATWFASGVAPRVASVALVPDVNAGVLAHLASHVLSAFRFRRAGLVEGGDVLSVLARAEWYLNEQDLDAAARELNGLRGTAKVLLADWLDAARRRLEVLQALEVMQTEATLRSLLVAQD